MHQKIILGNRMPIVEEKLIEYIIDGIPDHCSLRNQARVGGLGTKTSLMVLLFEQVEMYNKKYKR
jgi:hypothetical protein